MIERTQEDRARFNKDMERIAEANEVNRLNLRDHARNVIRNATGREPDEWQTVKGSSGPTEIGIYRLGRGESIRDFTSTKGRRIQGPATVEVHRWPDGGLDGRAFPSDDGEE